MVSKRAIQRLLLRFKRNCYENAQLKIPIYLNLYTLPQLEPLTKSPLYKKKKKNKPIRGFVQKVTKSVQYSIKFKTKNKQKHD